MRINANNPENTTPSELIEHVAQIIKEREAKTIPTYYTIKIEQYGKLTPVAEREQGTDNFKTQMLKYTSDYKATALVVELFHGKTAKVKVPFQTFNVYLTKQNPPIHLGNAEVTQPDASVQQIDSAIPVERYYNERFDLQMRIMHSEMDKRALTERLNAITERYEEKLREQDKRTDEKQKTLEDKITEQQRLLNDFEQEIGKYEKQKHNSFGNIALGSVGAHLIENFIKSRAGTGLLKGFLGDAGYESMQNHLKGIGEEPKQLPPPASNDQVVSEPEPKDPRNVAIQFITQVAQGQPDLGLRMIYDISEVIAANSKDLEALWSFAQEIKQARAKATQRGQQTPTPEERQPNYSQGDDPEDGDDPEEEDPNLDEPNID